MGKKHASQYANFGSLLNVPIVYLETLYGQVKLYRVVLEIAVHIIHLGHHVLVCLAFPVDFYRTSVRF